MPEVAEAPACSAALIKAARRITVKVGSSLLVDGGGVRQDWLRALGDDVPADVDLAKYRAVTIWCRRFAVNFGTAPLAAAQS